MYSGIINHHGIIRQIKEIAGGGKCLRIFVENFTNKISIGSSVNVQGICLTVIEKDKTSFAADVMAQTLNLTTADEWGIGHAVNLEPSLKFGDEMGGHLLYGHIDGIATVEKIEKQGNAVVVSLSLPKSLAHFAVSQGSVGLDGVSLTVAKKFKNNRFTVSLIPETQERTTWKTKKPGDGINFEADMIIKYLWAKPLQS